jgi:uncharacterized protein (DUF58 family)
MQNRIKIRRRTRIIAILLGVLSILVMIDAYQGWRFLLLALSGAWGLSYLWVRSLAYGLRIRREMRFGWAQVGDQLEERYTLENWGGVPCLWIEIQDHSNLPGYQTSIVTGIESGGRQQWRTHGVCTQRGLFTLGPTSLISSDPLGLFTLEIHDPSSATLMVTPPIVPLPQIEVAPGGRAGEGRPRPNAPERTVSSAGVREYIPGDSTRWIHWRTSARRDDLYVRLFENTPSGNWWIILDLDERVQAGDGKQATEEHAVILAASLADRGLRNGRPVGLVANGAPMAWLPPREGDGQHWEILRSLALIQPSQRPFSELLERLRPTLSSHSSLVIITANASGDWLEGLLPYLWKGSVPSVLLLDPVSFGGDTQTKGMLEQLTRWGIQHHLITPDLLDRPEAQPGTQGRWEFRVTPTGRAIAVNPPRETAWKELR